MKNTHILNIVIPCVFYPFVLFFLLFGVVYQAEARQYTVEYIPLDELEPAPSFVPPNCLWQETSDACFAVVLILPRGLVADFDETTKNRRDQRSNRSAYSRTRTGQAYVLAFPMEGGYVEVEEPGGSALQNTRYRVEAYEPGDVLFYTVEKVPYTPAMAQRRTQRSREGISTGDLFGEPPPGRQNEPETQAQQSGTSAPARQQRRDYRTQFLWSIDASNVVRTNSDLFREQGLPGASSGYYFGITAYYLDGFQSARAGITALSSSGRSSRFGGGTFIEEEFRYSQASFFASYSPYFDVYESLTTYVIFYSDVGGSANLINFYYNDYEERDMGSFIDITEIEYEMEDVWAPGINFGMGFILNYKKFGIHIGGLLEMIYLQEFETLVYHLYPKVGINFRSN